jgi:hypothetical protein
LSVTVKDAGTGVDINAGIVEPLTGTVAFLTAGPDPIVLGEANVNNGQAVISTRSKSPVRTRSSQSSCQPITTMLKARPRRFR